VSAFGPTTTASPSSVKLLAFSRPAASAIAGGCAVSNRLADDHPISVILDFVHPLSAERRRCTLDRLGWHKNPAGGLFRNMAPFTNDIEDLVLRTGRPATPRRCHAKSVR
jgi:hypothetical protein